MDNSYLFTGLILVGVLTALAGIISAKASTNSKDGSYPKGHWMGVGIGIGISIGAGVGIALGAALENIALGIAIGPGAGVAVGAAIGSAMEQKNKDKSRPLSEREITSRKKMMILASFILALGIIVLASLVFTRFF